MNGNLCLRNSDDDINPKKESDICYKSLYFWIVRENKTFNEQERVLKLWMTRMFSKHLSPRGERAP